MNRKVIGALGMIAKSHAPGAVHSLTVDGTFTRSSRAERRKRAREERRKGKK